jgi:hypothetical protein
VRNYIKSFGYRWEKCGGFGATGRVLGLGCSVLGCLGPKT